MGPRGKTWLQVETTAQVGLCTLPCKPGPCLTCRGPCPTCGGLTGMRAGPFQLSPGSEALPGAGLSTALVTMTQALNHSKNCSCLPAFQGFHCGSDGEESACSSGALGLISRSGRFLGEGNGYPLQYSCLENYMDRGAWQATVHGVLKRWT